MVERLTIGTKIIGRLPRVGFWSIDMKRIHQTPLSEEEVVMEFNDKNLRRAK